MKREIIRADLQTADAAKPQYGALCWRNSPNGFEVLLITSRETGRWVVPKGWPMKDISPAGTAAREAWEEAGVEGKLCETCLGVFSYQKLLSENCSVPCTVAVYGLRVEKQSRRYPEQHQRRRKWFAAHEAAALVEEPELSALLLALAQDAQIARTEAAKKLRPPEPPTTPISS